MSTQQPEALVFADDRPYSIGDDLLQWAIDAEELIRRQHARIAELETLADHLKQEAQMHAMEARTANGTIAEIYQCVSGATGEPGNWNGAEPVRKRIAELEALVRREPLNPDMPAAELRLHMGELCDDEVLVARAAIRWANSK